MIQDIAAKISGQLLRAEDIKMRAILEILNVLQTKRRGILNEIKKRNVICGSQLCNLLLDFGPCVVDVRRDISVCIRIGAAHQKKRYVFFPAKIHDFLQIFP